VVYLPITLLPLPPPLLLLLLQAEADDEPLALSGVTISTAAAQQLTAAWHARRCSSLYPTAQHFLQLVEQVRLLVVFWCLAVQQEQQGFWLLGC
jgi:hypothetical protein